MESGIPGSPGPGGLPGYGEGRFIEHRRRGMAQGLMRMSYIVDQLILPIT
jgi:hypothetical protein